MKALLLCVVCCVTLGLANAGEGLGDEVVNVPTVPPDQVAEFEQKLNRVIVEWSESSSAADRRRRRMAAVDGLHDVGVGVGLGDVEVGTGTDGGEALSHRSWRQIWAERDRRSGAVGVRAETRTFRAYLLRFFQGVAQEQLEVKDVPELERAAAGKVQVNNVKRLNGMNIDIVEVASPSQTDDLLAELRAMPEVTHVEKDALFVIENKEEGDPTERLLQSVSAYRPNDPYFSQLWGMDQGNRAGDINAPEAWALFDPNAQRSFALPIVGVVDTGIDWGNPDLQPLLWVNEAERYGTTGQDDDRNGIVDDLYGYNGATNSGDPMDDQYHGTHVAGTVGAMGNNGKLVAGVWWGLRIMGLKFLDASGR
eukprot:Cvel_8883.t1-p1 / transcript=Cvel_8883.t1 / gene=Cvel_8883 / organism=Chromera_velia_CCMP2878 / gene_product=PC3-like endoprotease variant B, putative / transcript_product=PC3-like endoprotease variant B, putative / location=Cvel_scaffold499:82989-85060(+) / protein_length=365 / sequence_SO=supercontig / SO=protein_coding / is_pseudo=false